MTDMTMDRVNLLEKLTEDERRLIAAVVGYAEAHSQLVTADRETETGVMVVREIYNEILRGHRRCMSLLESYLSAPEGSLERQLLNEQSDRAETKHAEYCQWVRENGYEWVYDAAMSTVRQAFDAANGRRWIKGTLHQRISVRYQGMFYEEQEFRRWEWERPQSGAPKSWQ